METDKINSTYLSCLKSPKEEILLQMSLFKLVSNSGIPKEQSSNSQSPSAGWPPTPSSLTPVRCRVNLSLDGFDGEFSTLSKASISDANTWADKSSLIPLVGFSRFSPIEVKEHDLFIGEVIWSLYLRHVLPGLMSVMKPHVCTRSTLVERDWITRWQLWWPLPSDPAVRIQTEVVMHWWEDVSPHLSLKGHCPTTYCLY